MTKRNRAKYRRRARAAGMLGVAAAEQTVTVIPIAAAFAARPDREPYDFDGNRAA